MLVPILFTTWIVLASVLSQEVDKSTEILNIDHKSSDDTNNDKEVSSTEKDESAEKDKSTEEDRSTEKDSSVERERSDEKNSSVERDRNTDKLSSKNSKEEKHSDVKNIDDKFTKTTTTTITPGSTLPPCAMCNFQSGGMFISWSQPCPGCIYRPSMCSAMGACCIIQPSCPVSQYGMPCFPNTQLGPPMALRTSLVGLVAPRLPLGLSMAPRTSLVRSVSPELHEPWTIPQITPGISSINITKSGRFYSPGGGFIQSSGFGTSRDFGHSMELAANWVGVPGGLGAAGGVPASGGLVQNNELIHPIYQDPGLQPMITPGPVGGLIQSSGYGTFANWVGVPRGLGAVGGLSTAGRDIQNSGLVHPVYQAPGLQPEGNMWGGYTVINSVCPATKEACAELGGTCIPLAEKCGGVYKQDEQLCGSNCKCCIRSKIKDCRDLNKNCLLWARAGYCNSYAHIKSQCKVSCGICIPELEVSPPASSIYISNQCQDKIPNCEAVATKSTCTTHVNMRELCPKTCGVTCTKTQVLAQSKECNVKVEDAKICHQLGGNCIPTTTKCKGTSYPLCGSNACQCCVDNHSAFGSCSQKQGCGIGGTCTLGGCREGYQIINGQCPGPDCYCCKLKAHTICSDKPCGSGGTCRETTCLPGEVRLKENCGKGSCVCCKKDLCDTKKSCGNGGHCRCSVCGKNEERIYGRCKGLDCICCKPKKSVANKLRIPAVKPPSQRLTLAQYYGGLNIQNPVEMLNQIYTNKDDTLEGPNYYAVEQDEDYWYPEPLANSPSFLPPNDVKESFKFPLIFKDVPKCKPPKNNVCWKKGGDCIPLDATCNGRSSTKYCGKKKTCQCCLLDVSSFEEDYKYIDYPIRPIDHLVEADNNESVNPSVSFTDDTIETIQSITEDSIQSMGEDGDQSIVVDNIESMAEDNSQSMVVDNSQPLGVDDVQSMVVDNIESIATENISFIGKDNFQSIATNGFLAITADASLASDNKVEDRVVNTPSNNDNTPMNLEALDETPRNYYIDYQAMNNGPVESNYEFNNLPEMNMIDYYDSVNVPLDGIEPSLNSKEYYDMNDVSSMVNNNEKDINDNNDALNDNSVSDLDPLQNSNDYLDYLNYMSSMDLDILQDVKEYYVDKNNDDSVLAKSTKYIKDYYEEKSNIPTMDYYNQVNGNPSMDSATYVPNYDDIYPSVDDDMKNIPSSDAYYSLGKNDYYNNMADYPIMNQYDAQY